jgi:hypothetical protein
MNKFIDEIVQEIAIKHAKIIEEECKKSCEKFNCNASDLVIQYNGNTKIKILVKSSDFEIINIFTYNGENIKDIDNFVKYNE